MGGRYSTLPEPKSISDCDADNGDSYFALALLEPNKIVLVHAGSDVIGIIQKSIRGDRSSSANQKADDIVQKEARKDDNSYEIQFRGNPFSKFGSRSQALRIKRLLCHLVADLYMHGWDLSVASDLTTDDYHTTWFFRKTTTSGLQGNQGGQKIRSKRRIVSLSLSGSDSLTLINAPERLRKALIDAVRFGYTYGTEGEDQFEDDLEIKLNGGPWETNMLEEGIWARKLLLEIFRQFSKHRYAYYAVADTKGTADSIFFIHQQIDPLVSINKSINQPNDEPISVSKSTDILIGHSTASIPRINLGSEGTITRTIVKKEIPGSPSSIALHVETEKRRSSFVPVEDLKAHSLGSASKDQLSVSSQPRRSSWQEQSVAISSATPPVDHYPFLVEQFFMVSLNRTDSLRLIDGPKSVQALTKSIISQHWPYGLQRETKYEMAYEFRLNGSPWASSGPDAVAAHSFLTLLFEKMLQEGWRLLATLDISRRRNDKSVFVLKKDPSLSGNSSRYHFCLSMTDGDKIRLIRGDEQIQKLVKNVIAQKWPYGVQKEKEIAGAYELQLAGHPWLSLPGNGNEPLSARVMLLELLRAFHANQWKVIVSADISGRYQTPANLLYNPVSVDSWIVAKEVGDEPVSLDNDVNGSREKSRILLSAESKQ